MLSVEALLDGSEPLQVEAGACVLLSRWSLPLNHIASKRRLWGFYTYARVFLLSLCRCKDILVLYLYSRDSNVEGGEWVGVAAYCGALRPGYPASGRASGLRLVFTSVRCYTPKLQIPNPKPSIQAESRKEVSSCVFVKQGQRSSGSSSRKHKPTATGRRHCH